jgi:hypothetical protein
MAMIAATEKDDIEHVQRQIDALDKQEQVTKIYGISKIYPDPCDAKGKWYDQDHDLFYAGIQGKTDGFRYNIGRKENALNFEMVNFQFAGYFRINIVTHLEDSTYKAEYPEADINPHAKNRWAMKFGTHASHNDQDAATYEVCGAYLGNDVKKYLVGAEAPWKRMWRCKKEKNFPKASIHLRPLKDKWSGAIIFRWNGKDDKSVHIESWVDLAGLNEYNKPQNRWIKYLEFDDDGKKLESNGKYFKPIIKNRGKKENYHTTLRVNSVEFEAKYLFVREIGKDPSPKSEI